MFYNHEVLTSRRYGVATVWLVATLGAKSTLKQIKRRDIFNVDISKACETIVAPATPMALRLQSNLLFGVSRVYSQKCEYVLLDVQNVRNSFKILTKATKGIQLETNARLASRSQLMLPDDPAFAIDINLATEMLDLDTLQPPDVPFSQNSFFSPLEGSQIAAGDSSALPSDLAIRAASSPIIARDTTHDGGLLDEEFRFDGDGNLVDLETPGSRISVIGQGQDQSAGSLPRSNSESRARLPNLRNLREASALGRPARQSDFVDNLQTLRLASDALPLDLGADETHQAGSDPAARPDHSPLLRVTTAHARARRSAARVLPFDEHPVLRTNVLRSWDANYLQTMLRLKHTRRAKQRAAAARRNAEWWIYRRGVGRVGAGIRYPAVPGPLADLFSGVNFLRAAMEIDEGEDEDGDESASPKRGHDDEVEQDRRVRQRQEDSNGEEDTGLLAHDDFQPIEDDEVEMARAASTPMAGDRSFGSTLMPWTVSASNRSSFVPARSAITRPRGPRPSSVSGTSFHQSMTTPRVSNVSNSVLPLHRPLAAATPTPQSHDLAASQVQAENDTPHLQSDPGPDMLSIEAMLERDLDDFVAFVQMKAMEVLRAEERDVGCNTHRDFGPWVTFEELLDPAETTRKIACTAFMHSLTLGTGGGLKVNQEYMPFADISLGIPRA